MALDLMVSMTAACETMTSMRHSRPSRNLTAYFGAILLTLSASAACASSAMLVDNNRLTSSLMRLENASQSASSCQPIPAYSTENQNALRQLARLLQNAGMMTHRDVAGNLIGRLEGRHAWPSLVIGASIDTASAADRCNGFAGIMAAIEIARSLHDNGTVLDHPLEIIVWADSAGRMLGSRSVYDVITSTEILTPTHDGATVADGIAALGGAPDNLGLNHRANGTIAAYLELQVETDPAQHSGSEELGIVQQFAGIQRWNVRLVSNTENRSRSWQHRQLRDAANRLSTTVVDLQQTGSDQSTAQLDLSPTASTTNANATVDASFRLDIRAHDLEHSDKIFIAVRKSADRIGNETGTRFIMEQVFELPPGKTDQHVAEAMGKAASQLGLSYVHRRSTAVDAAQALSALAPVGFIIVPGRANSQEVSTSYVLPDALANGTNILLRTLLELDKQRQERSR